MPYKSIVSISLVFLLSIVSLSASASPWIDVGDLRLRNNLQLLNDSEAINISLTTWPVMWADVKKALNGVDSSKLSKAQKSALRELRFEMRKQSANGTKRSIEAVAGSSRPLLRHFGSFQREKWELHKSLEWDNENLSYRLQANAMNEPGDGFAETDFYGSYIAGVLGGKDGSWVLGLGAIDRWWGASSQSSLILSNNAKPVPGIFLRTKQGQRFESSLLSWIGEWSFVSYLGQMESNRVISRAKLMGMRFTMMPMDGLEIGLSRGMQWGGKGRDNDLSTFWRSLTSQGENTSSEAGNQLAGYDVRYGFGLSDTFAMALHAQSIGEDEAGYLPARRTIQGGIQLSQVLSGGDFLRYELEYANTTADAFETVFSNITYEHSTYRSGYRYHGRSLGASFDNDTEVLSAGVDYQNAEGALWSVRASYLNMNEDGVARGNQVSRTAESLYMAELYHQCFIFEGRLKAGLAYLSKDLDTGFHDVQRLAASLSWEYRY